MRPHPHERRREVDGSLRVVYAASIRHCRPCPLRQQCQWQGSATAKPRQVSVLLHPLQIGSAPLLWRDWSRREHRRACLQLVQHQRLEVSLSPPTATSPPLAEMILSRAQRAHSRLGWQERLARNARPSTPARHDQADRASRQPLPPRSGCRQRNLVLTTVGSLFPDKLASPGGAPCPLFLAGPHFFLSSACFALHPDGLAISDGLPVRLCRIFSSGLTTSSSTSSLRISWACRSM
jgi:hypothetical protein